MSPAGPRRWAIADRSSFRRDAACLLEPEGEQEDAIVYSFHVRGKVEVWGKTCEFGQVPARKAMHGTMHGLSLGLSLVFKGRDCRHGPPGI